MFCVCVTLPTIKPNLGLFCNTHFIFKIEWHSNSNKTGFGRFISRTISSNSSKLQATDEANFYVNELDTLYYWRQQQGAWRFQRSICSEEILFAVWSWALLLTTVF